MAKMSISIGKPFILNEVIFTNESNRVSNRSPQIMAMIKDELENRGFLKSSSFLGNIEVKKGTTVDTLGGNDKIVPYHLLSTRPRIKTTIGQVVNFGTLLTGKGKDSIYKIRNTGVINTGPGNDLVTEYSDYGTYRYKQSAYVFPELITGEGNDKIINKRYMDIIGLIDTGNGNDIIAVEGTGESGLKLTSSERSYDVNAPGYPRVAAILTGNGNDQIIGKANRRGIELFSGYIDTGRGNDYIIGESIKKGQSITNYGRILLGKGDDVVIGGAWGTGGAIDLGPGNDKIVANYCYGNRLEGGKGHDTIVLDADMRYKVSENYENIYISVLNSKVSPFLISGFEELQVGATTFSLESALDQGIICEASC